MFARTVNLRLKPDGVSEFTQTIENQIIPLLRKQQGFQDEITFVAQGGVEAVEISLWDQKENAEAYNRGTSPDTLRALAKVVEGTPRVQTYEVSNSTFHKIPAPVVATRIAVTVSYVGPQYGPNQEFIADLYNVKVGNYVPTICVQPQDSLAERVRETVEKFSAV